MQECDAIRFRQVVTGNDCIKGPGCKNIQSIDD